MRASSLARLAAMCAVASLACGRTELDLGPPDPSGASGAPGVDSVAAGGSTGSAGRDAAAPGVDAARDRAGAERDSVAAGGSTGSAGRDAASAPADAGSRDGTSDGRGPVLYTTCSTLGALDCSSQDPHIRLLCDGMTWNPVALCTGQLVCDTRAGSNHGLCTGSDAGDSADAGDSTSNEDPGGLGVVLYTTCSTLGALDCSIKDPKIQVLCDGMTWGPIGLCAGNLVCDKRPGPGQGLCKAP
jgi:hypothetical protein